MWPEKVSFQWTFTALSYLQTRALYSICKWKTFPIFFGCNVFFSFFVQCRNIDGVFHSMLVTCKSPCQSVDNSYTHRERCYLKKANAKLVDKFTVNSTTKWIISSHLKTPFQSKKIYVCICSVMCRPFLVMHELPSYNSDVNINLRASVSPSEFGVCVWMLFFRPSSAYRDRRYHSALSAHTTRTLDDGRVCVCVLIFSYPNIIKILLLTTKMKMEEENAYTRQSNENELKRNETNAKEWIYI